MRIFIAFLLAITVAGCNRDTPPPNQQNTSEPRPAASAPAPPAASNESAPEEAGPGTASRPAEPPAARSLAPEPGRRGTPDSGAADRTPPEARAPEFREVTVPSGTTLPLELETAIASDTSHAEEPVRARLRRALVIDGVTVAPAGTPVTGVITAAEQSGKVKGLARVACRFTSLRVGDEQYDIRTSAYAQQAKSTKKKDAAKIGIPAAGGAIIGGIVGGKKGATIGGAAGGGAGTAVVLSTRGDEVRLPAGTAISVRLLDALHVRVPLD